MDLETPQHIFELNSAIAFLSLENAIALFSSKMCWGVSKSTSHPCSHPKTMNCTSAGSDTLAYLMLTRQRAANKIRGDVKRRCPKAYQSLMARWLGDVPPFAHLFLLYRPWTAAVPPTVLPSPNQLQKMATMRKKERGQRPLRSSRVLRRVRVSPPPQFLPNRDVADRQGARHG